MKSKENSFEYNSICYSITKSDSSINITIYNNQQIKAQRQFSLNELTQASIFFHMFQTINEVSDQFTSFAKENKFIIKDKHDYYQINILPGLKHINKIKLLIGKLPNHLSQSELRQKAIKAIETLFNNQMEMIKQMTLRVDKTEAYVMKMYEDMLTLNSKLHDKAAIPACIMDNKNTTITSGYDD